MLRGSVPGELMRFSLVLIALVLTPVPAWARAADAARGSPQIEAGTEVGAEIGTEIGAEAGEIPAASDAGLRMIEPGQVPDDVERFVRFRAYGLGQDRAAGGSIELSALYDSNINRVTRSDALGSVISGLLPGDAELAADIGLIGEAAKPGAAPPPGLAPGALYPGIDLPGEILPGDDGRVRGAAGASLRGQGFVRRQLDNDADLLVRLAGNGEFYGDSRYDDLALTLQAGPEWAVGSDRIALFAGPAGRWYGAEPYSLSVGGGVSWQHPFGRGGQLRLEASAARVDNRRDALLDGGSYTFAAEFDRALTWRSGLGARLLVVREATRDPAYALASAGIELHAYREFAGITLIGTAGYTRLEADAPFPGYAEARQEDRFTASLGATLRALRLGPLAPLARVRWENNRSTLWFYDFERWSGELGLVLAF
jgi:hypothetical protein